MGKIYKYSELKGVIKVGDRVKAVDESSNACSELEDSQEGMVTKVGPSSFNIDGCPHLYSSNFSLELLTRDLDHLQEGDALTDGYEDCMVLGVCGKAIFLSKNGRFSEPDTYAFYTANQLEESGWKLKDSEETTEITMDEVAKKMGIPVEKLRIKKED